MIQEIVDKILLYFRQDLIKDNTYLRLMVSAKEQTIKELNERVDDLIVERDKLLSKPSITQLEALCSTNFKEIPIPVYKFKREIKGVTYALALNELITPSSYSVLKFFGPIKGTTTLAIAKEVGSKTARYLTWTDDKNLSTSGDYYLYPNEALSLKLCDCEDHSYVNASAHPEIGIAYGFYNKTMGHAFNVFVFEGKLYVLDTVGDIADVIEYTPECKYYIHYIFTRTKAYALDESVIFGELASW